MITTPTSATVSCGSTCLVCTWYRLQAGSDPRPASCVRGTAARSGVGGCVQSVSCSGCLSMSARHTSTTAPCLGTGNQIPSWEQKLWVRGFIPRWNQ